MSECESLVLTVQRSLYAGIILLLKSCRHVLSNSGLAKSLHEPVVLDVIDVHAGAADESVGTETALEAEETKLELEEISPGTEDDCEGDRGIRL